VMERFPNGTWFVDLSPLSDPGFVPQAIANVLGVPEAAGKSITETLVASLQEREMLLLLDNCEHLAGACARLCDVLLRACPKLHILATSREALHMEGEVVWLVPSMALPDPDHLPTPQELIQYASVRLLVERSRAVFPAFDLTAENAPVVAQLCFHLDGIPLAIELAAARTSVLSIEQILARLDDRFRLLTRGSRTALNRQQTLQAAIDWSYDLLTEPERVLFRRLTIFAGGWSLEAAESVASDEAPATAGVTLPPAGILDGLSRLVDQSLVLVEQCEGEARYRMLETIREYACQRREAAGETPAVAARLRAAGSSRVCRVRNDAVEV
jgi:predicted ATPase